MEAQTLTFHVRHVATTNDGLGYINYVFEDLECIDPDYRFIMCVRFPNWNQGAFNYGDEGFVTVRYVFEGTDKWFDGKDFIPYKDTNIIFMKFIPLKSKVDTSEIILD